MTKKRIAVLCSGGGTNFQRVIDACNSGEANAQIVLMISSSIKAYAVTRASAAGIPVAVLARAQFASLEDAYLARHNALISANPDLIVLAGYLGVLLPQTVRAFSGRIINTHPALIPAFCGKGMYGRHVHEAVLAYGAKISGATIHFVTEGVDEGPVIAQQSVPVLDDDTPEALAQRVLPVEHALLGRAVALFCQDRLTIQGRKVRILP